MDYCLFEIVVCFVCNGKLYFNKENFELVCKVDNLVYLVCDGILVLLENEVCLLLIDEKYV